MLTLRSLGVIQIIRHTFSELSCRHPSPCLKWTNKNEILKKPIYYFIIAVGQVLIIQINLKNSCFKIKGAEKTLDNLLSPPKCHVLFEWPRTFYFIVQAIDTISLYFLFFVVWSIYSDEIHTTIFLQGFVVWLNFAKKGDRWNDVTKKFLK